MNNARLFCCTFTNAPASSKGRTAVEAWNVYCNYRRPHSVRRGRPPIACRLPLAPRN
jgi:hypothetical protein